MANSLAATLQALGAVAASGSGSSVDIGTLRRAARVSVDVLALSGTNPSLAVKVETSADEVNWRTVYAFASITTASRVSALIGDLSRYVRVAYTLGGTGGPSVTWSSSIEAHVLYCEPSHVTKYALPEHSIAAKTIEERLEACLAASDEADGFIASAYEMPLVAWTTDVTMHCAYLAGAVLFGARGADLNGPDALVFHNRDMALKWFDRLANGRVKPPGIVDSTPETFEGGAVVESSPRRGW